ncbi:MAG: DUF5895 domain-containing protein [Stenomitos frigidus ULC029]
MAKATATAPSAIEPPSFTELPLPTAPVVATGATDDDALIDDYADNLEESKSLPYAQVLALPNMAVSEILSLGKPYGFFIPESEAQKCGFKPDERWETTSIVFGDIDSPDATTTAGWVTHKPRFLIIHRSQSEVQEKVTQNGKTFWKIIDFEWANKEKTEAGFQAEAHKSLGQDKKFRTCKRLLIVFLGADNEPLHGGCIKMTIRGGFAGAFGAEMTGFYQDLSKAYVALLKKRKPQASGYLDMETRAKAVIDLQFSPTRQKNQNPYLVVSQRFSPLVAPGELVEKVDDQDRKIRLVGTNVGSILLRLDNTTALIADAYYAEYEWFKTLGGRDGTTEASEPAVALEQNEAWLKYQAALAKAADAAQVELARKWVLADKQFAHLSNYADIQQLIATAASERNEILNKEAVEEEF